MGIAGSSLVFATGIEVVNFNTPRVIDRVRIRSLTWEWPDTGDRLLLLLDKGFEDPDNPGTEQFIQVFQAIDIVDTPTGFTLTWDNKVFNVPSGTHFTDLKAFDGSPDGVHEQLEDAVFAALESMNIFSGTETDI